MKFPADATIYIIDDDPSVRRGLANLLRSHDLTAHCFTTTEDFLAAKPIEKSSCLVLDVRLPGINGLAFQERLAASGPHIPVVFITGHGDVPMCVRAMKAGAVDFLEKPFTEEALFSAIQEALEGHRPARTERTRIRTLKSRLERLTPRELEVLAEVVSGKPNKRIAAALGTTEKTIKVHRGRVMEKMEAKSLPDLVRMSADLGIG